MNLILTENDTDNIMNVSSSIMDSTTFYWLPQLTVPKHELNISGLFFLIIPTITILGNSMVIIAVLRFKTLHSAINFLIFGLAVADLLVGLFVMPYAVYVHVQGGYWFLGSMMCDIYSASDVACSTASILLLTVISFDRYRAVTHPISYSRKSHDTRRVIFIMTVIWIISLALASPIVLGVNIRPSDADPYECRFYNPIFSISSSIISFVIPCFIVLFVYIRIMIVLRQRQKLSKMQHSSYLRPLKRLTKETTVVSNFHCGGQRTITENVKTSETARPESINDFVMKELNLDKERKKKLVDILATVSKVTTLSCKIDKKHSKNDLGKLTKQYDDWGVYMNKAANDDIEMIKIDDSDISNSEQIISTAKKSCSEEFLVQMMEKLKYNNLPCPCRQITLSRFLQNEFKSKENSVIYVPQPEVYKFCELQNMNISGNKQNEDTLDHGELKIGVTATDELALKDENDMTDDRDQEQYLFTNANIEEYTEIVIRQGKEKEQLKANTDSIVAEFLNDKSTSEENDTEIMQYDRQQRDSKNDGKNEWRSMEDIEKDSDDFDKTFAKTLKKYRILSNFQKKYKERKLSLLNSSHSIKNSFTIKRTSKIFRRPLNRGNSFSGKHCSRTQRMEKRATKTLGIVVGIFLACWVPFFSVYILSAICIQMDIKSCQADFYAFFYTTWLGYINSCINPIIYTIFNVEFRRAFKHILFGKFSIRKDL
ncbi:Dopamine receptor [Dirofilaria immitis]